MDGAEHSSSPRWDRRFKLMFHGGNSEQALSASAVGERVPSSSLFFPVRGTVETLIAKEPNSNLFFAATFYVRLLRLTLANERMVALQRRTTLAAVVLLAGARCGEGFGPVRPRPAGVPPAAERRRGAGGWTRSSPARCLASWLARPRGAVLLVLLHLLHAREGPSVPRCPAK